MGSGKLETPRNPNTMSHQLLQPARSITYLGLLLTATSTVARCADWHVFDGDSIQAAIDVAVDGDRVLVHPGTYDGFIKFLGKDLQVIAIYGPTVTLIDNKGAPWPAVSFVAGEPISAVLKGFAVEAQSSTAVAILVKNSSATLVDCTVKGGSSTLGGGMHLSGSTVLVDSCSISGGSASDGGGIYADATQLTLRDSDIQGSASNRGGALLIEDTSGLVMRDCSVTGSATSGGGLHTNADVVLNDITFKSCSATQGGGVFVQAPNLFEAHDCTFSSISASNNGSAVYSTGASILVNKCSITGNSGNWALFGKDITVTASTYKGGSGGFASTFPQGTLTVADTLFKAPTGSKSIARLNQATASFDGCLFLDGGTAYSTLAVIDSALAMTRCVLTGHKSSSSISNSGNMQVLLEHCVLAYNPTTSVISGGGFTLDSCIVWGNGGYLAQGGVAATYSDIEGGFSGVGNIDADPIFADVINSDFSLIPGSPCIGTGNGGTNMGADLMLGVPDCNGNGISDAIDRIGNDCNLNGIPDDCDLADGTSHDCDLNGLPDECQALGVSYCTENLNSTGYPARITGSGSADVANNCLLLSTDQLPLQTVGIFLASETTGFAPGLGGGQGDLCLGSPIFRFEVLSSGNDGAVALPLDLANLPSGMSILPGTTWSFQFWYRDLNPDQTSNLSGGLSIGFS
jgi:Right handed beta helix region